MKVPNEEIVIFVSSLHRLEELNHGFVFSDRHAYLLNAQFYNELPDLTNIDWTILQNRDFRRDPDDPAKIECYQAEALVHQYLPVEAIIGVACYTEEVKNLLNQEVVERGLSLEVRKLPGWYF